MLFVVQFPICDARSYSSYAEAARLPKPGWPPNTGVNREFVREFGEATERRRGPDAAYLDEYAFVDARRAIGFEDLTRNRLGRPPADVLLVGAFRRLFCDLSRTIVRVEIGLARRPGYFAPAVLDGTSIGTLVEALLLTPTSVPSRAGKPAKALQHCGSSLAELYARSTTKSLKSLAKLYPRSTTESLSKRVDKSQNLVRPGQPLVVVEFDGAEKWQMPSWVEVVPSEAVNGAQVDTDVLGATRSGPGSSAPDRLTRPS